MWPPDSPPGEGDRRHDRDDLDAGRFPGFHILAGVAGAGGDDLNPLLDDDFGEVVGVGAHEHDVYAEGLVRQGLGLADLLPDHFRRGGAARDEADAARIGDGCGQGGFGDPRHAALEDGVLDAEQIGNSGFHIKSSPFSQYSKTAPP